MNIPGISTRMVDDLTPPTDRLISEWRTDPLDTDYSLIESAVLVPTKIPFEHFFATFTRSDQHSEDSFSRSFIPMTSDPVAFQRLHLFSQIHQDGFSLNMDDGAGLSVGMVNAMDAAQPGSEHELRLLFYSPMADNATLHKDASRIFGGIAATYQTSRLETAAGGKLFLGAGFDANIDESSLWMLHMYAGFPIYAGGSVAHDYWWYPYWELGLVREGVSDKLFLGCSVTASLFSPDDVNDHYIGLAVRYEN